MTISKYCLNYYSVYKCVNGIIRLWNSVDSSQVSVNIILNIFFKQNSEITSPMKWMEF